MIVYRKARAKGDLDDVHRLRDMVSCQQRLWDPQEPHPAGHETDVFDQYATHVVARHFDLVPVGTVRMVLSNPLGLPVENFCGVRITERDKSAEISKLAISNLGIRISGARKHDVLVGLLRSLCCESRIMGIDYWYAMLTDSMYRLARRSGLRPVPVARGADTEQGAPYVIELQQLENLLFVETGEPRQSPLPMNVPPSLTSPRKMRGKMLMH